MIKTKDVCINYKEGNNEYLAVNHVSLTFESGSFSCIIGRSGSGKTSFLNALGGLLKPTSGQVMVNDMDLYKQSDKKQSEYRSNHIGYIFQNFYLENHYTVEQNLEIVLMISGYPKKKRKERIKELLKIVGLEDKQEQKVAKLSGGERQRVCIARAIANNPEIILADEPCGNLDTYNGEIVMQLLRRFANQGKTVVLVTHNLEDAKKTDRVIELKDGIVISDEKNGCTSVGLE